MKKIILSSLLVLSTLASANDGDYSLRLSGGSASASDFDRLFTFQGFNTSPYETKTYGLTGGYRIYKDIGGLPFDLYANGGLNYYDENGYQDNFFGADVYVKVVYKLNAFSNEFRIGLAEGMSYVGAIPHTEMQEAILEKDAHSNLLNYMELTFDFDIGKLARVKSMENLYLGYLIKHRSGMYGVYNNVKDGGSNYNCAYIEKKF
ncbi:MAG: hypothetical protein WC656_09965 [Sulfurimonas sp.]|jgi:outer membrane protein